MSCVLGFGMIWGLIGGDVGGGVSCGGTRHGGDFVRTWYHRQIPWYIRTYLLEEWS